MDTEGLGANSSLGAALPPGLRAPGLVAFPPQVTLWTETALQAEKHTPNAKKASSFLSQVEPGPDQAPVSQLSSDSRCQ